MRGLVLLWLGMVISRPSLWDAQCVVYVFKNDPARRTLLLWPSILTFIMKSRWQINLILMYFSVYI